MSALDLLLALSWRCCSSNGALLAAEACRLMLREPELHLGPDVFVPDLAGWRRERMPEVPVDLPYFVLPPDWACEVLSPSTAAFDRGRKLFSYAREEVRHVWIIEPAPLKPSSSSCAISGRAEPRRNAKGRASQRGPRSTSASSAQN